MKKIILMTTLLLTCISDGPSYASGSSVSGTPITDEMSSKYFSNCVASAQKEGTMTKETQNQYCACTAMNMQKTMSQEDLVNLSTPGDKARKSLNKVLISVNGPCMQYPTHDLIHKKCMTDVKSPEICSCLSNKMGIFMKDISGRMLPDLLKKDPNLFDPVTPIMETSEFIETQRKIALSCATNPTQK
ncbi:MAG: hypothetical protein JNL76_03010 [Alphaproteobacteria bacterium]|nr:hypothetical protein [Alphaproteobacteria bacterium]